MRIKKKIVFLELLALFLSGFIILPCYTCAATLTYKSYVIRQDMGKDIMCEPYIVQKSDWVLKLFRQKGEIADRDFPEFLSIFKRLNPNVRDINIIRPGQHIFIPLKKLYPGSIPGQASGIVTIPFVTISNLSQKIQTNSLKYKVKKGDCVSSIIAGRYGKYGTKLYQEGIKLFKVVNPDIKNIDCIYTGQTIYIPEPSLQNKPGYQSYPDKFAGSTGEKSPKAKQSVKIPTLKPDTAAVNKNKNMSHFLKSASILDARLLNRGKYFFPGNKKPGKQKKDIIIDLSLTPVIETKNGYKVLFCKKKDFPLDDKDIIKSIWQDLTVAPILPDVSVENIIDSVVGSKGKNNLKKSLSFSDGGIEVVVKARWIIDKSAHTDCITLIDNTDESTPNLILRYLAQRNIIIKDIVLKKDDDQKKKLKKELHPHTEKDISIIKFTSEFSKDPSGKKSFVNNLLSAMNYNYTQNVNITFPYAGIQVEAISNIIFTDDGNPLLVDFESFYGDALAAIKKSGFGIIQIKENDVAETIIQKILAAMHITFSNNPVFYAAKRPDTYNTSLTIPGFLIEHGDSHRTLLAASPLQKDVIQFLQKRGLKIIIIKPFN